MRRLVLVAGLLLIIVAVTASAATFVVSPSVLWSTVQVVDIQIDEPASDDDQCLPPGPPHDPPGPPQGLRSPPTGEKPPFEPPGPPCVPPAPPFGSEEPEPES